MIRKATQDDFTFIKELYFHPNINPFLLYEMSDIAQFESIYADLLQAGILYVFYADNQPVGMFKLGPFKWRTSHIAYLGGVGVHPDFAGQGHGESMLRAIIDYALDMGIRRVELSTATFNDRAIRLYEKVGFVREGVLRNYTHLKSENRYIDELLMSYVV